MKGKEVWLSILLTVVLPFAVFACLKEKTPMDQSAKESTEAELTETTEKPEEQQKAMITVLLQDETAVEMELESYLVGVLLGEMPSSFPLEAKKAQAVVARTYALRSCQSGGKHGEGVVCAEPSCCQCYRSTESYLADGGSDEAIEQARQAVAETSGQVLTYDGALIEATYFSCSGGRTEDAVAVWGSDVPYLQATDSPGEEDATHFVDTVILPTSDFFAKLGLEPPNPVANCIEDISYTDGGGVSQMRIAGTMYSGTQLRKLLGLRSTAISISIVGNQTVITTKGFGHRVGMSQYGAKAMAESGKTYDQILAHYYMGTELSN